MSTTLPNKTIVYVHRRAHAIGALLPSGERKVLYRSGSAPFNARLSELYGIAFDPQANGFWIAEKRLNAVHFTDWTGTDFIVRKTFGGGQSPDLLAPCTIDIHASLGLLVACFGKSPSYGALVRIHDGKTNHLTPSNFNDNISHCCWLPDGGFCYVSRTNSILWHCDKLGAVPMAVSRQTQRKLSPTSGSCSKLALRYVQGLVYSKVRKSLLIADASLGVIFEVDPRMWTYQTLAGRATLSDSTSRAELVPGSADRWLGPIRGLVTNDAGHVHFLDGESGRLWMERGGNLELAGQDLPELNRATQGSGITILS